MRPYEAYQDDANRLAYQDDALVNWCAGTGYGAGKRGSSRTERANAGGLSGQCVSPLRQWMLRITSYAERLLDESSGADLDWPVEHQKTATATGSGAAPVPRSIFLSETTRRILRPGNSARQASGFPRRWPTTARFANLHHAS